KQVFTTGQIVTYTPQSASVTWAPDPDHPDIVFGSVVVPSDAIEGLTAGTSYYVLVKSNNADGTQTIQLSKDPPLGLDGSSTNVNSTQTLQRVETDTFSLDAIDPNADTISIAEHGLTDGMQVRYDAGGNTDITGLHSGDVYTVVNADDTSFQ